MTHDGGGTAARVRGPLANVDDAGADVLGPVDVALHDAKNVVIRPLLPADALALERALSHADPWDLRRRFMGSPPPIARLVERLNAADGVHNFALGAFTVPAGELVGVAQFDRLDDGPAAEVAIEVAKDWQRDGVGLALLSRLVQVARARGIRTFTAMFFADNLPVLRLLHDAGVPVTTSYAGGVGSASLDLDPVVEGDDD